MSRKRALRLAATLLVMAALAGMAAIAAQVPAQAAPGAVDPSSLGRGADPRVAYLLHDTIHDGALTVHATSGDHSQLWTTSRGFLVLDGGGRLTYVARSGDKQLLGRKVYTIAVSADGRRVVWGTYEDPAFGPPVHLRVANVATGRVVARRTFSRPLWAQAVGRHRVMVATARTASDPATWWWRPGHRRLDRMIGQAAVGADLRHDRMTFSVGGPDSFCDRVSRPSHPHTTLWRSCSSIPHQWSPDGRHALATHTYFDDTGTNYWSVLGGTSGRRVTRVTGRLDWNAVWEDDQHFLTSAMGADGRAAVVRCDLQARCERASRLWNTGWTGWPPFYVAPPVLLSRN